MSHMFVNSTQYTWITQGLPYRDYNFNTWQAGRHMGEHSHGYLQMIHVLEGALEVDWGNGWRGVRPGDVHILPPGTEHALRTTGGQRQFGLNFDLKADERGMSETLLEAFPHPTILSVPSTLEIVRQLESLSPSFTSIDRLTALQILDQYCLALLRDADLKPSSEQSDSILQILRANTDRLLKVDEMASQLGMSRATLQRTCKRIFGCGIAHLHQQVRLTHAADLLTGTDELASEIAETCGYPDVYQFSRAFKRHYGIPPTHYRRDSRERMGYGPET